MVAQDSHGFADELSRLMGERGLSPADVADMAEVSPSSVSRWLAGKVVPHDSTLKRLAKSLGVNARDLVPTSIPRTVLFVAAPITGLQEAELEHHHDLVQAIVNEARRHIDDVRWPGEDITDRQHLRAAGVTTEENLRSLASSDGLVYIQFAELSSASGALIELGIALGKKLRTTAIILKSDDVSAPFMLTQGFSGVARGLNFLPRAEVHYVSTPNEAVSLIRQTGARFFGLHERQGGPLPVDIEPLFPRGS